MWRVIGQEFSRLMARTFGPSAAKWAEENGVPVFGVLCLLAFGFAAVSIRVQNAEVVETDTPEGRRRNLRFGRWMAAVLFTVGLTLLGRSLTFGPFESQKVQEVAWSLAAGTLGTTAWALLLLWWWPTLTRRERWRMCAGLLIPVALGILFVVLGATRSTPPPPPPSPEEEAKAVAVIRQYGGSVRVIDWKSNSPIVIVFRKRSEMGFEERPKGAPPGPRIFTHTEVPLRDDDLPPLLDALRVLQKLTILDLSDTALTPAGVERVRAAVPNATVTGPPK
jgi:hypothetical protein